MKVTKDHLNYPDYYLGASHTNGFINPDSLKVYLATAAKCMKTIKVPYDTLAFAGISGAVIGPALAIKLKKECLLVRKDCDKHCTRENVSGHEGVKSYLIVDDLIDSGRTVEMIQKKIYQFSKSAKCIGVVQVQYLEPSYTDLEVYTTKCNLTKERLVEYSSC